MSYKNFICTGPNDVAKYNNNPVAPDFLEHFAKTSYITADFQKILGRFLPIIKTSLSWPHAACMHSTSQVWIS